MHAPSVAHALDAAQGGESWHAEVHEKGLWCARRVDVLSLDQLWGHCRGKSQENSPLITFSGFHGSPCHEQGLSTGSSC